MSSLSFSRRAASPANPSPTLTKLQRTVEHGLLPTMSRHSSFFKKIKKHQLTNLFFIFIFIHIFSLLHFSGGKLVASYVKKPAKGPRCGDTGVKLNGIPALRPKQYKGVAKRVKSVSRTYGGSLSAAAVKARIVRAFLIEEQKIVKKVLQEKSKGKKKKKKKSKK